MHKKIWFSFVIVQNVVKTLTFLIQMPRHLNTNTKTWLNRNWKSIACKACTDCTESASVKVHQSNDYSYMQVSALAAPSFIIKCNCLEVQLVILKMILSTGQFKQWIKLKWEFYSSFWIQKSILLSQKFFFIIFTRKYFKQCNFEIINLQKGKN